jgi:hypothetical protein
MTKHYLINISHYCSFKAKFEKGEDALNLACEYIKRQNKGLSKSDRIFLKSVKKVSQDYDNSPLWDQTYLLKTINPINQ